MRINFNRIISVAFSGVILLNVLQPLAVLAQTNNPAPLTKGFCVNIAKATSRVGQEMAAQESKLVRKRQSRMNDLIRRRDKRDERRDLNYAKWESDQQKHYAKFEARAQTDAQKQAVANFKTVVDAAVLTRKQAVNLATKIFRDGMDQIIANRKSLEDAIVAAFKTSVSAALLKVKADCLSGVDPKTAKSVFNQSMKDAQHKLAIDRKNLEKNQELIEPLNTARKQATQKAKEDFRSAVEKARADLKAALKSK